MFERRMKIAFTVFLIFIFTYIVRIGYFSIFLHQKYSYLSVSQRLTQYMYHSNRGDILDRNLKPLTDRTSSTMIVYSPYQEGNEVEVALIAKEYNNGEDMDFQHYIVEKSNRNCGVAEHLIGLTGYAPYHKIKGFQGLSGLEKQYDKELSGKPASVRLILDGNSAPVWWQEPMIVEGRKSDNKLVLTLDLDLQDRLEQIIDENSLIERGAVVVMDPFNGQILSMISRPRMNYSEENDGSHLNKAIQIHRGANPASVFKLIIGLYALENDVDPKKLYECTDMCIYPHGSITFEEAIAKSCNQVFYEMVGELGPKEILHYANKLGLGTKSNVGLNQEGTGRLPKLDTVIGPQGNRLLAMGQGQLETTPLQIAKVTSVIANGGFDVKPKIVHYVGKNPREVPTKAQLGERVVSKGSVREMKKMMELTTTIGTARQLSGFGGVKTGTANNGTRWMTGYFPQEKPQYVVTIFIEEGYGKKTMEVTDKIIKGIFKN